MSEFFTVEVTTWMTPWIALLLLQITVVATGGLVLSRFFRRDPATRHAVLLVTLIVMFACPVITAGFVSTGWTLWGLPLTGVTSLASEETAPRMVREVRNLSSNLESDATDIAASDPESMNSADLLESDQQLVSAESPLWASDDGSASWEPVDTQTSSQPLGFNRLALMFGLLIWIAGCLLMILRMLAGWLRVRKLCRAARQADSPSLLNAIAWVNQQHPRQADLRVLISDQISTAFVAGLWHHVILVPRSYLEVLSEEELFSVLSHEVAHLIRRDLVVGFLQRVIGAVYWPHPLLHVINRWLGRAREEICDNFVLQQFDEAAYSNVLLRLTKAVPSRPLPAGTLAFLSKRWKLEDRIAGLLDTRRQRATKSRRRVVVPLAALVIGIGVALAGLRLTDPSPVLAQGSNDEITGESNDESLPGGADMRLGRNSLRHGGWHKNVGFSADGRVLVTSSERSLKFWDTGTGQLNDSVDLTKFPSQQMLLTPDRRQVAVLGRDLSDPEKMFSKYGIRFWDMQANFVETYVEWELLEFGESRHMAFTPDGQFVLVGDSVGYVSVWELASGEQMLRYHVDQRDITGLDVSPDGQLLAITTQSRKLYLWNWLDGTEPEVLGTGRRWNGVKFSPDGQQLAVGLDHADDQAADVYDVSSGRLLRALYDSPKGPVIGHEQAFTPDGKQLALANSVNLSKGFVAAVLLWDIESGELVRRFTAPGMRPRHVDVSPDGRLIAAVDWDLNVRIWDIDTGKEAVPTGDGHSGLVRSMVYSASSEQLLTAGEDHSARLWDAVSGQQLVRFEQEHGVQVASISQDGSLIATAGSNDIIVLWDAQTGTKRHTLPGKRSLGGAWELAFSPDQSELIALEDDLKLRRWSTETGDPIFSVQILPSDLDVNDPSNPFARPRDDSNEGTFDREELMMLVSAHAFTPDATRVLITSRQNKYWAFDAATGEELFRHDTSFSPYSLAISPDQQRVVFGSRAQSVQSKSNPQQFVSENIVDLAVADLESGEVIWQKRLPASRCKPVRFSSDGRLIAAVLNGSGESKVMFFDAATGDEVHTIEGTKSIGTGNNLAFSPNGHSLALAQHDGTILTWKLKILGPAFVHP